MSLSATWKIAEAISKAKAYFIGNGMDKVLIEALNTFEKLPEKERTYEHLKDLLNTGIQKEHEGRVIRIVASKAQRHQKE